MLIDLLSSVTHVHLFFSEELNIEAGPLAIFKSFSLLLIQLMQRMQPQKLSAQLGEKKH
jgi:hypothetical protein